jgi:hypothetical protein
MERFMNAIDPAGFGEVSTIFAGDVVENDLGAGVTGGFGVVGYKGKVWSIRKGGQDIPLMRDDGDGPRNSIEVVILKASTVVSKIFYENGYVEGSTAPPDCYSTNGVSPAPGATKKQAGACANCPKNAWGSRITPAGKQGKACSDSKRLAVVPLGDIRNEGFGGPMLLRVPAASLTDMALFGDNMKKLGFPYYSFGTRIAFDAKESYPKFVFGAIRRLTDDEARLVKEMRDSAEVTRVLAEEDHHVAASASVEHASAASPFEQDQPGPLPVDSGAGVSSNVIPMQPRPWTGAVSPQSAPPVATIGPPYVASTPALATGQSLTPAAPMAQPIGSAPNAPGRGEIAADTAAMQPTGAQNFDELLDGLLSNPQGNCSTVRAD